MDAAGAILVAIRWTHLLAAVALVGSALFALVVIVPGLRHEPQPSLEARLRAGLREVIEVSLVVLLLSGVILVFERLGRGQATTLYVALLGAKIGLAIWMFGLGLGLRRAELGQLEPRLRRLALLGAAVLLLAVVLRAVFEAASFAVG